MRDLMRLRDTTERHLRRDVLLAGGRGGVADHRYVDRARQHEIDAHLIGREFGRGIAGQPAQCPFARAVADEPRSRAQSGDRGDVDDRAAASCPHRRQHRLDTIKGANHIDLEIPRQPFGWHAFDRVASGDRGVVDKDVDAAEAFGRHRDDAVPRDAIGHVVLDEQCRLADHRGDVGAACVPIGHDQRPAGLHDQLRGNTPLPARCAGEDHHLAG